MKKRTLFFCVGFLVLAFVAGTVVLFNFPYSPTNPPIASDEESTLSGVEQVVKANNEFAFDIYSELNGDGNLFYSSYSISAALAMVYEGSKGQTNEEIKSVFHFPEEEVLRSNFASIYNGINSENNNYELRTGNALWVREDFSLLDEYVENVENYYGGKATNLDFVNKAEISRGTINSFIEEQTNGKIEDLIPAGALSAITRLVITNAIYFKGTWEWQFDKSDTHKGDFYISSGEAVEVDMMSMSPEEADFNYANLEKLKILELDYEGGNISMLILLPKQETAYDFETGDEITYDYSLEDIDLSLESLEEYKSEMGETSLDYISIPKFEFDTEYSLEDVLVALGMPTAFSGEADFSGMTSEASLFINSVIHKAYVKVDEEGTEAAAATAVVMADSAVFMSEEFVADHSFVFIIQEKDTGNILFMGRVENPGE